MSRSSKIGATSPNQVRPRPGRPAPCSDEQSVHHTCQILEESPFHGEGYRKVWTTLRFKGIRTPQM